MISIELRINCKMMMQPPMTFWQKVCSFFVIRHIDNNEASKAYTDQKRVILVMLSVLFGLSKFYSLILALQMRKQDYE